MTAWRLWRAGIVAGLKALLWGALGPAVLYSALLFIVIILYNVRTRTMAAILPVAETTLVWSLYFGIVLAGPFGALGALAVTWQAFRWTSRGDEAGRVRRKALALGALFGLLFPVWLAASLAIVHATTFSGRFTSPFTFVYMATNSVPVAVVSAWILLKLIRSDLVTWSRARHA